MLKRLRWLIVGFVLGLGSSWALMHRVRQMAKRYVPAEVADRWSGTMRAAVEEGRTAMRERESELKATASRGFRQ